MNLNVYSIYDLKAKVFALPFYAPVDAVAVRNVGIMVNDDSSASGLLAKHPEDFSLYRLAVFNDEVGVFEPLPQPAVVCMCAALKREV